MKVILQEDIKGLGKKGDLVDVAEGYGRNYLFPRKLAVSVTEGKLRDASFISEGRAKKDARLHQNATNLAAKMDGLTVTVASRAGEGGKLYGAITSRDIALELERVLHQTIDKRKIELSEPIKSLGMYKVQVRLHPGVQVAVQVQVVAAETHT